MGREWLWVDCSNSPPHAERCPAICHSDGETSGSRDFLCFGKDDRTFSIHAITAVDTGFKVFQVSEMAPIANKRRRGDDDVRKPKKKIRKVRQEYHSSSEESEGEDEGVAYDAPKQVKVEKVVETPAVNSPVKPKSILKARMAASEAKRKEKPAPEAEDDEVERNTALNSIHPEKQEDDSEDEAAKANDEPELASSAGDDSDPDNDSSADEDDVESMTSLSSSQAARSKKKRNDPSAFATSISKILDTKLTTSKRSDPVLSRSKSASKANKTLADQKLEAKARAQIRAEKKQALEKGRVKDVLGLETEGADTGKIQEEEKRLKKTAQRGVVKLFNAVRAAQIKAEEAMKSARQEGVVGMRQREERVNEMSKQGFLDLISSGGKKAAAPA